MSYWCTGNAANWLISALASDAFLEFRFFQRYREEKAMEEEKLLLRFVSAFMEDYDRVPSREVK